MFWDGCAGAFEERGPMLSLVGPVTHHVEVRICDFHKNSRSETKPGLQNTNGFFWVSFETSQQLQFCIIFYPFKNVILGKN